MENKSVLQERACFLSLKEVLKITGMSKSTIYRLIRKGDFPRPKQLSARKVGFLQIELENWIDDRETAQ
jgi:prophage regulatory protein